MEEGASYLSGTQRYWPTTPWWIWVKQSSGKVKICKGCEKQLERLLQIQWWKRKAKENVDLSLKGAVNLVAWISQSTHCSLCLGLYQQLWSSSLSDPWDNYPSLGEQSIIYITRRLSWASWVYINPMDHISHIQSHWGSSPMPLQCHCNSLYLSLKGFGNREKLLTLDD